MDADSRQATKILAALAESSARSMELVRRFQAMPEVSKVSFDFDCFRNHSYWEFKVGSPYVFQWYVEVALNNSNAIWWALDVHWDADRWFIETRVELPGDSGPNILKEFPERTALTVDEFVHQLYEATSELVESGDLVNSQL